MICVSNSNIFSQGLQNRDLRDLMARMDRCASDFDCFPLVVGDGEMFSMSCSD